MDNTVGFTFFGDLLGISGFYRLAPEIARKKLNEFYNTTFFSLSDYCRNGARTEMFSDSVLVYGPDALTALRELHQVYVKLLHKGLLLRGAIVKGMLQYEQRLTHENYEKRLPTGDTLARAVGLEKTQKGARLLIENSLAQELLIGQPEWLTHDGYVRHVTNPNQYNLQYDDIRRRICPTPDQDGFECLYFWICDKTFFHSWPDYEASKTQLVEIKKMLGQTIGVHYSETIELLKRCRTRQAFTAQNMDIAQT